MSRALEEEKWKSLRRRNDQRWTERLGGLTIAGRRLAALFEIGSTCPKLFVRGGGTFDLSHGRKRLLPGGLPQPLACRHGRGAAKAESRKQKKCCLPTLPSANEDKKDD
jgi:hypothetical protein